MDEQERVWERCVCAKEQITSNAKMSGNKLHSKVLSNDAVKDPFHSMVKVIVKKQSLGIMRSQQPC